MGLQVCVIAGQDTHTHTRHGMYADWWTRRFCFKYQATATAEQPVLFMFIFLNTLPLLCLKKYLMHRLRTRARQDVDTKMGHSHSIAASAKQSRDRFSRHPVAVQKNGSRWCNFYFAVRPLRVTSLPPGAAARNADAESRKWFSTEEGSLTSSRYDHV